jgi:CubicO group peptidase (beta-lactamase class C family)
MRKARLLIPLLSGIWLASCQSQGPSPVIIDIAQPWATADAAQSGMDAALLARAVSDATAIPRFRSLLVARHGKLVLEQYLGGATQADLFDVRSVTKSVVSALTGIALSEGKLPSLDATVGQYLGAPYVLDAGDKAVTVRQLLTMTSGYAWNDDTDYNPWILSSDHVQYLLDRPQQSGAGFDYDSAAVHLLGVVLQNATATPLPTYAQQKLFQPLGVGAVQWEQLENGMVNGGSGIQLAGRDLLRLGQLVLQEGMSGKTQLLPMGWVGEMVTPRFPWRDTDGPQRGVTYGYLWWLASGVQIPAAFAWGYGGQFVYVAPSLDLVAVTTTNWVGLSTEADPVAFAETVLGVVVSDVLPAAH